MAVPFNSTLTVAWSHESCPNQCSGVGTCGLVSSRGLLYGICKCGFLYGGDDCSVSMLDKAFYGFQIFLLVVSNCAVFPAAIGAFRKQYAIECFLFAMTGVASSFYHLCDEGAWCIGGYAALQFSDFWFAYSSVIAIVLVLTGLPAKPRVALLVLAEAVVWCLFINDTSTRYIVAVAVCAVCVVLFSWTFAIAILSGLTGARTKLAHVLSLVRLFFTSRKGGAFNSWYLLGGTVSVCLSLVCWVVQTNTTYFIWHSLWHVLVMLAPWLYLRATKYPPHTGYLGR